MKQLLILSGKGGTGKTTVAASFIKLGETKKYADCDVDAPNLHLISNLKTNPEKKDFIGLPVAYIDQDKCTGCDICRLHCRFDAINVNEQYTIDPFACEGCKVCEFVCPVDAISMVPVPSGELMLYKEDDVVFSTAKLKMGRGTSGLLVSQVKKQLFPYTKEDEYVIIDGSPGIGCPVIASLSGVDMVLIVTEPSISGISDMERIIHTAEIFKTKIAVCINKHDTNIENTKKIIDYCEKSGITFVGKIPYDTNAVKAVNKGIPVVDIDCPSGTAIKNVYENTFEIFKKL